MMFATFSLNYCLKKSGISSFCFLQICLPYIWVILFLIAWFHKENPWKVEVFLGLFVCLFIVVFSCYYCCCFNLLFCGCLEIFCEPVNLHRKIKNKMFFHWITIFHLFGSWRRSILIEFSSFLPGLTFLRDF